jgi:hypothetical protein
MLQHLLLLIPWLILPEPLLQRFHIINDEALDFLRDHQLCPIALVPESSLSSYYPAASKESLI